MNGSTYSTAAVSIGSNGVTTVVPFSSNSAGSSEYYGTFSPYQAGQTYVLSSVTSAGTAAATMVAPGGGIAVNSNGTTVTWNHEGNSDRVQIQNANNPGVDIFNSSSLSSDVSSPYSVPTTVYNGYSSPTTFVFYVYTIKTSTVTNAYGSAGIFEGSEPLTVIR